MWVIQHAWLQMHKRHIFYVTDINHLALQQMATSIKRGPPVCIISKKITPDGMRFYVQNHNNCKKVDMPTLFICSFSTMNVLSQIRNDDTCVEADKFDFQDSLVFKYAQCIVV